MRAIVRRHRLQPGDQFVIEGKMLTIVRGRLEKTEALSPPILEVHDEGRRCVLADGTEVHGTEAVYIERDHIPTEVQEIHEREVEI